MNSDKDDSYHSIESAHLMLAESRYGRVEVVQKITFKQLLGVVLVLVTVGFAIGMFAVLTNPSLKDEARIFGAVVLALFLFPLRASWRMMLGK